MRLEIGDMRLFVEGEAELSAALRSLVQHYANKELAAMLGVSERTLRRWKDAGLLPQRGRERLTLLDLIREGMLAGQRPGSRPSGAAIAAPAAGWHRIDPGTTDPAPPGGAMATRISSQGLAGKNVQAGNPRAL